MKIIAVWACLPRRARLSPSHSPRFLCQAEANDRLKLEVKRLKEAEDEKEKDAVRFKVTKRAPNAPEYNRRALFVFEQLSHVFQDGGRKRGERRDEAM